MAGKIFINYRRDDVAGDARGIRDGLAAKFGKSNVFMDVDNLLAGQRFDKELDKALAQCDVIIAVMGPRWMELLTARAQSGERDYVRDEIAAALAKGIVVIPVRAGREGSMPPLPRAQELPDDIRDLVLHQKHDVAHERFGRDIADLVASIGMIRRVERRPAPWGLVAAGAGAAILAVAVAMPLLGVPMPWTANTERTSVPPSAADFATPAAEAWAAAHKADYDESIARYDEAIRLNPGDWREYLGRGNVHQQKGEYDRSIADYTKAIRLNPNYAEAYNNRGVAYDDTGEIDRAIADYTKALAIDPLYEQAKDNLKTAKERLKSSGVTP